MVGAFFPSEDPLSAAFVSRVRELKMPLLRRPNDPDFFLTQVKVILQGSPIGRGLEYSIRNISNEKVEVICLNWDQAQMARDIYEGFVRTQGTWQTLPYSVQFRANGRRKPLSVPYTIAANANTEQGNETGGEAEGLGMTPTQLAQFTPQSRDEEIIQTMNASSKPASLVSMRKNKVLAVNPHVMGFCNEAFDDIIGYDIMQLFEERRRDERFKPTDILAFHERLKQDRTIHGEIRSWRSSGVFAIYPVTAQYVTVYGVPVRMTFFDPVEIVR